MKRRIEVIGLSGKAGSGKDFVGREILRPAGFRQWAMAWPMKNEATGHGYTYEEVHDTKPPEVREFLQKRGTEDGWMKYGKLYWCKIAESWLRTISDNWGVTKFYFTDIRFEHEVKFIQGIGGRVVRLELGNRPGRLSGDAAEHSSETALDNYNGFDARVYNGLSATAESIASSLLLQGILPAGAVYRAHETAYLASSQMELL